MTHQRKPETQPERAVYTANEMSTLAGINVRAVYRMAREGKIPCIRAGKRFVFPRAAIDRWLTTAGHETAA
jgi:excisionase family DNA binding protein